MKRKDKIEEINKNLKRLESEAQNRWMKSVDDVGAFQDLYSRLKKQEADFQLYRQQVKCIITQLHERIKKLEEKL